MSGGYFEYDQYKIGEIADQIARIAEKSESEPDSYFSKKTVARFRDAIYLLKRAEILVHRIDWLLSGDDDEESFHERLAENLSQLDTTYKYVSE